MERVSLTGGWRRSAAVGRLALGVLLAAGAVGAAPSKEKAKAPAAVDDGVAPAKAPRREINKIRQGSLLKRDAPAEEAPDLRGDAERRRDQEVVRHFERIAELDVIEQLAAREDDLALLERVEAVRRKELRRHWARLQQLRAWVLLKNWQGNP